MEKMDQAIKDRWVAALRSGDYTQGQGRLHATSADGINSFCCLGVLCDLANKENIVSTVEAYTTSDGVSVLYDDDESWLPTSVAQWSGVDAQGTFNEGLDNQEFSTLAYLNDSGATFEHIAEVIEEYL
jgi:hypothetical protein